MGDNVIDSAKRSSPGPILYKESFPFSFLLNNKFEFIITCYENTKVLSLLRIAVTG